jgi:DNA-binding NtrC family response regulator
MYLTDLKMEGMDGINLLNPCLRNLKPPVIVMTAYGPSVCCRQLKEFDYLSKPLKRMYFDNGERAKKSRTVEGKPATSQGLI